MNLNKTAILCCLTKTGRNLNNTCACLVIVPSHSLARTLLLVPSHSPVRENTIMRDPSNEWSSKFRKKIPYQDPSFEGSLIISSSYEVLFCRCDIAFNKAVINFSPQFHPN